MLFFYAKFPDLTVNYILIETYYKCKHSHTRCTLSPMNTHMHTPTPVSIFESKPVDLKIDEVVTDASGHVIPLNFNLIFFLLACYFKGYVCLLDHPRLKTMATPLILWVISICQSLWSHGCNRGLGGDNDMQRMFVVKGF